MMAAVPASVGVGGESRHAFGDFIGFQTAWGYWIAIWAGNAAIAVAFVGYLAHFWPGLGRSDIGSAAAAVVAIWLLTAINAAGVREAGLVQVVTTVAKVVPLAVIAVAGLFFMDTGNFQTFNPSGESTFGAIGSVATLTLWAFIGLESATVPADHVRDPHRTIPRATVIGTLIATAVYVLGTVAVLGVIPAGELAGSSAPFADAATSMFGGWAGDAVAAVAMIAAFGALNGWILLQGQIPHAAARDGLFPLVFARTSRSGTPVVGLVVSSVLVTALMAMNHTDSLVDQFTFVILLATLTTLIPYAYSAAAELKRVAAGEGRRAHVVRDATVAALAFGYSLWTIAGAGYEVVYKGSLLLLAGIPVYILLVARAVRNPEEIAAEVIDNALDAARGEKHRTS